MSVARTPLVRYVVQAGLREPNRRTRSATYLKPIIERLIALSLVTENKSDLVVEPEVLERVVRRVSAEGRFARLLEVVRPVDPYHSGYVRTWADALRQVRWAIHLNHMDEAQEALKVCRRLDAARYLREDPLLRACARPFDPAFLRRLPGDLVGRVLTTALEHGRLTSTPAEAELAELVRFCADEACGADASMSASTKKSPAGVE